jgi:transposase-like protein
MAEDYPRTLLDLERRFATEAACLAYLAALRWPEGFHCPACGSAAAWQTARGLWVCRSCQRQTSVTAGTIFGDSHLPLQVWFRAIWLVVTQKDGASALGLQRVLGLGSYRTAWSLLHKLRRAMIRPGRERLRGIVEVDESYWGAPEAGKRGRQPGAKTLLVAAVECVGPRQMGRVRLRQVAAASAAELQGFVAEAVEPGSTVRTDGWAGYRGLGERGYDHDPQRMQVPPTVAVAVLPRVHLLLSLLKRWLLSTHQGAVRHRHLDYYLDEFAFRFNRRASASRGKLFYRLVQQAAAVETHPYTTLRGGKPPPPPVVVA